MLRLGVEGFFLSAMVDVSRQRTSPLSFDLRRFAEAVALVALGLGTAFDVSIGGRLFYSEIALLAMLPFLLMRLKPHPATERFHKPILVFGLIWLWSQILTDLIRMTPVEDWTRGVAKITFLLLNYIALRRLLNTERRLVLFAVGLAIGVALASASDRDFDTETAWKFGQGAMYATLGLAVCAWKPLRRFSWLPVFVLLAYAGQSALFGARSAVGTAMIAAGILALGRILTYLNAQSNRGRTLGFLMVGLLGVGTYAGMGYLSREGFLGEKVREKYEDQVKKGRGNLLLGGRSESRISTIAIADSPIIGHGSWAKSREYRMRYEAMKAMDSGKPVREPESLLIPSHSFLLGAWLEAGILGAVWWLFIIGLVFHTVLKLLNWSAPLGPIAAFACAQLLWDIPFSPFGASVRVSVAFTLVLLGVAASQAQPTLVRKDPKGREVLVVE